MMLLSEHKLCMTPRMCRIRDLSESDLAHEADRLINGETPSLDVSKTVSGSKSRLSQHKSPLAARSCKH